MRGGQELALGRGKDMQYAIQFDGHGTFTPNGKVEMTAEQLKARNAELTAAELAHWATAPDRWQVYIVEKKDECIATTFTGEQLSAGPVPRRTFRNNFGGRTTSIRFKATNGATYYGRYGADWSLCRVRKAKSA